MKRLISLCFLMTLFLYAWGQDYLSRGKSYYANGNYSDAIAQYEAQLAYLDTKKVGKNADEYISVEKLLAKAKTCLPLSRKAKAAFNNAESQGTKEAYEAAIEACDKLLKQNSSDKSAGAMRSKCQTAITALMYKQEAAEAWAQVNLEEITSIETYIERYPDSQNIAEARQRIRDINDNTAWKGVSSKEDFENYLADYPNGLHSAEAQKSLEHWDESLLWGETVRQNTEAAYKDYLRQYPEGIFASEANQGIKNIQDDKAWAVAVETHTRQGYRGYSLQFPSGRHKDEARQKINEFDALQKQERDAADAFKRAPSLNGLRSFEKAYPNSEYLANVYDSYAQYLCDCINLNSCKKSDFKEAMTFAQTQTTKNKINAKEQEWQNLKSAKKSQAVGKAIGYVLVGGAIVAGVVYYGMHKDRGGQ